MLVIPLLGLGCQKEVVSSGPTSTTTTVTTSTTVSTTTTTTTTNTTITLGPLHVSGSEIVDANNAAVILKGVNIADPYYLDKADAKFNESLFSTLKDWKVKVVRVPVHPGAWIGVPNYAELYLDPLVEWCRKYGMYVILDWHAIGNPVSGTEEIQSWEYDPTWASVYHPVYESDLTYAKQALANWAERYQAKPWVIYEIFNEPAITGPAYTWAQWKIKAEELVDAVRAKNSQALVLVSGLCWTSDLRDVGSNPIARDNIVYAVHCYPNSSQPWETYWGYLKPSFPLLVTEWGYPISGLGTQEDYGAPLLSNLQGKGVGWTAWCFHPTWLPNMLQGWDYQLTDFGKFVKDNL